MTAGAELDTGSFRDPDSRVFYSDGAVLRALSERGAADWRALAASRLFADATAAGRLVATEEIDVADGQPLLRGASAAAVLRHERIPFVSYPYEWTPGMLRDAALLQLDLLLAALDEDLTLKDATPYNLQFRGALPIFVDVGSFESLRAGRALGGLPAVLRAVPLSAPARGLEGRAVPALAARLAGGHPAGGDARADVVPRPLPPRRAGARVPPRPARPQLQPQRAHGRRRQEGAALGGLQQGPDPRERAQDAQARRRAAAGSRRRASGPSIATTTRTRTPTRPPRTRSSRASPARSRRSWCGTWAATTGATPRSPPGTPSWSSPSTPTPPRSSCSTRALREARRTDILPLTLDLVDSSPGLGWRGRERRRLEDRGQPDLVLCLALMHHVCITGNVPVAEYVAWLAALRGEVVVELVRPEDPMVRRLLAAKAEGTHPDYDEAYFERALGEAFDIERREVLPSGTRVLYHARPR